VGGWQPSVAGPSTHMSVLSSTACMSRTRCFRTWRARLQEPPPIEGGLATELYLNLKLCGIGGQRQEDKPWRRGALKTAFGLPAGPTPLPPLPPAHQCWFRSTGVTASHSNPGPDLHAVEACNQLARMLAGGC
jgi:hypothetical protein